MKFSLRAPFSVSAEALRQVVNDPEYQAWAASRHSRNLRKLLREEGSDPIQRTVQVTMKVDLPRPIAKLFGGSDVVYLEHSEERAVDGFVRWWIDVKGQESRIDCRGTLAIEVDPQAGSARVFEGETKVSIFGVGSVIEKMVTEGVKKGFEVANGDIQTWLNGLDS